MRNSSVIIFGETYYACTFRPYESALTSVFALQKHEPALIYFHRYQKTPRINALARDPSRIINTTKDVFASVDTSGENAFLDICGDDEIVHQIDREITAHAEKRSTLLQAEKNGLLAQARKFHLEINCDDSKHMAAEVLQLLRTWRLHPQSHRDS